MPRYEKTGVSFDPPPGWTDGTIVTYYAPSVGPDAGPSPSVTMAREALKPGDTLHMHAHRLLVRAARVLRNFELLRSSSTTVGGRPGALVHFRFATHTGTLEQTTVMVDSAGDAEGKITVFSVVAQVYEAEAQGAFLDLLKSVQFEATTSASPLPPRGLDPSPEPASSIPVPGSRVR
jgi:hypothetical protein